MKINFSTLYSCDADLRRAFSWLARVGIGRRFGSLPIGWYQMHQCAALDILEGEVGDSEHEFRAHDGFVQHKRDGRWHDLLTIRDAFNRADREARK